MPILHYMYYAKYGSGLLRVSMSYAYQGVNRKQVLHPRIPRRPRHTVSLQVPHAQTVATDSEDSMGCMAYRSRDRGEAGARQFRAGNAPFPLQHGGMSYRFRCMWGRGRPLKHTDSGAIWGKKVP